ncbi:MAG: RNA polymerase sigma factor [Pseudomonadota bacterium]
MSEVDIPATMREELRATWHRYLDLIEPLRPALHRYCRHLTGTLWDAEDLVQDTVLRGFGTLGAIHHEIRNPQAYLLRIAANLWIDSHRRRFRDPADPLSEPMEPRGSDPVAIRDATKVLLQGLAPQERAAVVLKDVFDFTLDEIATMLGTSTGAVKAALHRGRTRLREGAEAALPGRCPPSVELVDRFVAAFNARDVAGVTALLLDGASAEVVGCVSEHGAKAIITGSIRHTFELEEGAPRAERRQFRGEPIVIVWYALPEGNRAGDVLRIEEQDGQIAFLRYYAFCPETLAEVAQELGLPLRTRGYHYRMG